MDKTVAKAREIERIFDPLERAKARLAEAQRLLTRESDRYYRNLGSNKQLLEQRRDAVREAQEEINRLEQAERDHRIELERQGPAILSTVELTDKQIKALEKAREALIKEREARLESIDETWRHVEALEDMGRRMEKLSNEGLQAAIDSFETAIPDPEFIRDAIKPFEEMMLGKPGKPPMSEEAEKVKTSMEGAAKSLVTTVAGGTIGGIFNSLASGDWVGAAMQGVSAVWGWLSGKDDERRRAREEAQAERIRMWEEEREKRIADAKDVWEEEKRLAIETLEAQGEERIAEIEAMRDASLEALEEERDARLEVLAEQKRVAIAHWEEVIGALREELQGLTEEFSDATKEMFDWGRITDDFAAFLERLPDHIDADAIRAKIQGGLDQLRVLSGQQSDVQGLQGLVGKHASQRGLQEFLQTGVLTDAAAGEYAAAGGDAGLLQNFADALRALEHAQGQEEQDPALIAQREAAVQSSADALQADVDNTLVLIHEAIKDVRTGLEEEISRTEEILTEPLVTAIEEATAAQETQLDSIATAVDQANATFVTKSDEIKATITTMLTRVQTALGAKLDALNAKTWDVNVHMTWPEQPGGPDDGRDDRKGKGTAGDPSSNAMGGPVGAGEYSWVGERGPELVRFGQAGTVIPNQGGTPIIVHSTIEIDGREVARAAGEAVEDEGY